MQLPEGWVVQKFGDVLDIKNGRNQKAVESLDGQYPILGSAGNVMGYATDYICDEGTTIIGRKGNISTPIYITKKFWNVDTAFGLSAKDNLDKKYLYYYCLSYNFSALNRGTTIPSLVKTDLLDIPIPVPPLKEQKRIVAILDEAFARISQAIANTEKNLANAQELFENYLLTLFKKYKTESEGKKFKDVVTIINGRNQKDVLDQNGSYPVLGSAGNIMGHATDFLCRAGTTIIGRKGNISKPIFIDYEFWNVDTAFGLVPNNNYLDDKFFFHYCLQYNFLAMNRGTTIPSLVKTDLLEIPIYYPDLAIQKEESKKTDSIFNQMELYNDIAKQKLQALAELKQSLLQKAFSGELTANNVDKWVNP
jgi:type I restriction enzyme S subunit